MKYKEMTQFRIKEKASVRQCMKVINNNKEGIALVINDSGKLVGTVTDGDIRRFLLSGHSIDEPVGQVMSTQFITAAPDTSTEDIKKLMNKYSVRNIPVLDREGYPCKIANLKDVITEEANDQVAVIMAGGEGQRLKPLTQEIPKPMVKVAGKPILENIIHDLAKRGIVNIFIAINYRAHIIEDYFGNGSSFGVNLTYLKEKIKLGTAGALTLLPEFPQKPIIVINGDVMTKTNFIRLIEFHNQHRCVMTVAAAQYKISIPFGVLNQCGPYLLSIEEKPEQKFLCNAGIYILNPEVLPLIPKNTKFDMTDLVNTLTRKGLPLSTFPLHEYWIDIGEFEELKKAQKEFGKETE